MSVALSGPMGATRMSTRFLMSSAWTMLAAFCALASYAMPAAAQGYPQWSPPWDEPWDAPRPPPRGYDRYGNPPDDRYDDREYDDDEEVRPPPRFGRRGDDRLDRYDRGYDERDDGEFAPPARRRDFEEPDERDDDRAPSRNPQDASRTPGTSGGPRPYIAPAAPPKTVFSGAYRPGSVVIDTSARKLYYVLGPTVAYAYPIGVGRDGFRWTGKQKVSRISDWPDWYPPTEMRKRKPELPERMTGGLRNPLGAKAIYLGSTLYRVHGTNDPNSIGRAESSGCFRMMNAHVVHLASLVKVGTEVTVVRSLNGAAVASARTQPELRPGQRRTRQPRWYEDDYDPYWRY